MIHLILILLLQVAPKAIVQASLDENKPIIFGVLTTNNEEQALERSDANRENKGAEFARSAMQMIEAFINLRMTQKTSTSPTRSRDKVLQSLYEIEVGGTSLKEVLKDQFTKKIILTTKLCLKELLNHKKN